MPKRLTVMFVPLNMVGPINAAVGMAEVLRDSGHQCVFAVRSDWKGKLKNKGFEEEIIGEEDEYTGKGSAERNAQELANLFGPETRVEKMKIINEEFIPHESQLLMNDDPYLTRIVQSVKPDVILVDHVFWIPALMGIGIPWVLVMTCNPLAFDWAFETGLPPSALGLSTDGNPEEWKRIKGELEDAMFDHWSKYNQWIVSKGHEPLPNRKLIRPSPYLNVYMFPEELDYTDLISWPKNFVRFDCFKRSAKEESFEVPKRLRTGTGKLVFLTLGSMGSGNVDLMKRLVAILSKSVHRFIVSKGVNGDQYQLADNMWGQNYLPQIQVLQEVDLVITHGGNNTLTETLYYGKPVIAMPMFFDQFDNAQRIQEKGFGLQLNPLECSEEELIQSIDKVLNDSEINERVKKCSKRIQKQQNILKISKLLEDLVERHSDKQFN